MPTFFMNIFVSAASHPPAPAVLRTTVSSVPPIAYRAASTTRAA